MFIEQLEKLSKEKGTNISQVLKELNISPSSATGWKNGSSIKSDILIKLANYFNCSTDYILERTEKKEPTYNIKNHSSMYGDIKHNENNPIEINELSYIDMAIIEFLKKMDISEKAELIKELSERNKKIKENKDVM